MIEKFSGDCLLYLGYTPDQLRKPALTALTTECQPVTWHISIFFLH